MAGSNAFDCIRKALTNSDIRFPGMSTTGALVKSFCCIGRTAQFFGTCLHTYILGLVGFLASICLKGLSHKK